MVVAMFAKTYTVFDMVYPWEPKSESELQVQKHKDNLKINFMMKQKTEIAFHMSLHFRIIFHQTKIKIVYDYNFNCCLWHILSDCEQVTNVWTYKGTLSEE